MVCARCQTTSESLQQEINCLTVHSTALQDECLQNLADGYESNLIVKAALPDKNEMEDKYDLEELKMNS
ncbi:hypothetical protein T07_9744 [Trichinella nelsoni]|uniref:Uncharacterized protein n=1 Tax=Trichinella nelsoni TaxID=6336 RepID=A0A0V0RBD8_9BILA|nr:hypothetical protein T07_9744 [Trichinella nelsoni]